jgi:hypothetical protein
VTVLKLTKWTHWSWHQGDDVGTCEQSAATTGQWLMRMLACYEEIRKEKSRFLSRQNSVLDFLTSSSEPVFFDTWRWWSRWTAYSSGGRVSSFKHFKPSGNFTYDQV